MKKVLGHKRIAFVLAVVAALAVSVGAYAYFTSSGSGTGSATVGSSSNYNIAVDTATGGPLYPGSGTTNLAYHVKNVGQGQQSVSSITAGLKTNQSGEVYDATTQAAATGCLATWFTVTNHPGTLPDNLANNASHNGSADVVLNDSGTNQDACQGVKPQLTVSAS